jgi:hypothetical protein
VWSLETGRQSHDAEVRTVLHREPLHFKPEKSNPLDLLVDGNVVLFRVVQHRTLIGGGYDDIFIPFADRLERLEIEVGSK